jgi:hypothetical protein
MLVDIVAFMSLSDVHSSGRGLTTKHPEEGFPCQRRGFSVLGMEQHGMVVMCDV